MKPFSEILANAKEVVAKRPEVTKVDVSMNGIYVRVHFSDGESELLHPHEATAEKVDQIIEKKMQAIRKAVEAAERLRHELGLFDDEETAALNEQHAESFKQFVEAGPQDDPFEDAECSVIRPDKIAVSTDRI